MLENQKTLKREYTFEGKGLHTGLKVKMTVAPAPAGTGIRFVREDIGPDAVVEASAEYVTTTQRGTTLEKGEARISTIEHLLSALAGMGVDNAEVRVNAPEAPILDGSALPYVRAIGADGLQEQNAPRLYYDIKETVHYRDDATGSGITI